MAVVTAQRMPHVVVLGGGIAGLSAAWTIKQSSRIPIRITIIESSNRLGGWLHSERKNGLLFERGCRGIRPVGSGKETMKLIESLGLEHQTLASSANAKTRYIWHKGQMQKVPTSLKEAMLSPLTRNAPLWALRDLTAPSSWASYSSQQQQIPGGRKRSRAMMMMTTTTPTGLADSTSILPQHEDEMPLSMSMKYDPDSEEYFDESLADFAVRRFGDDVAYVLLDAVMSGIYAGDVRSLSARATMSSLWKASMGAGNASSSSSSSHTGGSVLRGFLAEYFAARKEKKKNKNLGGGGGGKEIEELMSLAGESPFVSICSRASSVSFIDGTQTLSNELVKKLRAMPYVTFATETEVTRIDNNTNNIPHTYSSSNKRSSSQHDSDTLSKKSISASHRGVSVYVQPSPSLSSSLDSAFLFPQGEIQADAVVCSLPALALSRILPPSSSSTAITASSSSGSARGCTEAIKALREIEFGSVGVVNFGWKHPPTSATSSLSLRKSTTTSSSSPLLPYDGFGYLIPSSERGSPPAAGNKNIITSNNTNNTNDNATDKQQQQQQQQTKKKDEIYVLGMTWDSQVFPGQAEEFAAQRRHWSSSSASPSQQSPGGKRKSGYIAPMTGDAIPADIRASETRVTVMIGGALWPEVAHADHETLVDLASRACVEHVKIPYGALVGASSSNHARSGSQHLSAAAAAAASITTNVSIATKAIPQYNVGHLRKAKMIEDDIDAYFNNKTSSGSGTTSRDNMLWLIGNSLRGVGVSDTVAGAIKAGEEVVKKFN